LKALPLAPGKPKTIEGCAGKTIGVEFGGTLDAVVRKLNAGKIISYSTQADMLAALGTGKVDAIILANTVLPQIKNPSSYSLDFMVFQNFGMFANMDALRNIAIGQTDLLKKPVAEAENRAYELLKIVGLSERTHHFPHQLSCGQKQRMAIAQCLARVVCIYNGERGVNVLNIEVSGKADFSVADAVAGNSLFRIIRYEYTRADKPLRHFLQVTAYLALV
jgi:predicted ABC-type transport system involved in lysophospholipase L1 biosynthesis ATPase subunit